MQNMIYRRIPSVFRLFRVPSATSAFKNQRHLPPCSFTKRTMLTATTNALLADWSKRPFGLPPFEDIKPSDYIPAIDVARAEHLREIREIAENPEAPTFDNTVKLYDRAGAQLK
ncbi:hypothetical protein BDR26DRAFT_876117 [Obelidium mucronatum]|nr:hypothetical protein BDR26DRAFT_876117 [Obelidium mucronatum]